MAFTIKYKLFEPITPKQVLNEMDTEFKGIKGDYQKIKSIKQQRRK